MAKFNSAIKRIGVFTSGGDSPGMNAAIRAVVRSSIHQGREVWGIMSGYSGMIENNMRPLSAREMGNIIQ
ncbi:MAG: 6-phosphofructokinase, partial [Bdellovibrionaceae bacterium]|nr:6-phosphofructokinase [Pseudobdellovibrionaceae bacterium]